MSSEKALSIVVPLYNEEANVRLLYDRIRAACERYGDAFEVLFVDDGSSDGTVPILKQIRQQDPRVRIVKFRKNYGQTAAMAAGFEHARGHNIVSMDGDLQNDPADIPTLLAKLDEGYDVVCGWRKKRKDKFLTRRLPSIVANWIIGRLTGVRIHDNGCSLKAYRGAVIKSVTLYSEMHRFIPAMSTLAGARIAEVVVNHHPRQFGESKYGLNRVWKVALDIVQIKMITGFAVRPALWFGLLSVPATLLGLVALVIAGSQYLAGSAEGWVISSTVAMLLLFLGAHLLSLGIIGELAVNTGDYRPQRPVLPTIRELQNPDGDPRDEKHECHGTDEATR